MIFTFHDRPVGFWFSEYFDRLELCPCCSRPGVSLRYPRERDRRLWAHAMDQGSWLDVCERLKSSCAPEARLAARAWLGARWGSPGPKALALELGVNVQLLASIHAGRSPLPRSLPAVREAFKVAGIAPEAWSPGPRTWKRLPYTAVYPRVPVARDLDASAEGC